MSLGASGHGLVLPQASKRVIHGRQPLKHQQVAETS
jgi:hypothetical protein